MARCCVLTPHAGVPVEDTGDLSDCERIAVSLLGKSVLKTRAGRATKGDFLPLLEDHAVHKGGRAIPRKLWLISVLPNLALCGTQPRRAVLSEELRVKNPELRRRIGFTSRRGADSLALAERVITAVEDKHQPIAAYFASDCGARFMRRDSDMAVRVMQRVLAETGRCPLPVHDSFLVADLDQEVLARVMRGVAAEEGLPLRLKDSTGHPR